MPYYDHDKDYPFAAFITNLGKYNEGELVGEWVKFPTTAEELKEVFKRIGIGQKDDFCFPVLHNCLSRVRSGNSWSWRPVSDCSASPNG